MKPLSGLDAAFLYAETPTTPMNVVATLVVEGRLDFAAVVARVEDRLPHLHPFRRRLVEMPFGFDHPAWIEDPDFDVRDHVFRLWAPAPGDERALEQVVGQLARRRLDRARPLWELALVEGLEADRTALVIKTHHAALDGVSGAALLLHLFDKLGDSGDRSGGARLPDGWRPDAEPGAPELLRHGWTRLRERPRVWGRVLRGAGRSAAGLARAHLAPAAPIRDAALPFQAPSSPWNGPLSSRRSVAYARAPLEAVQRVRAVFGGSLNDVVLGACTRALQGELRDRGHEPFEPLVAAVPVSTRSLDEPLDGGNRISAFLTHLPVQLEDPLQQLSEVSRATRRAKRLHAAVGEHTLASLAELATPAMAARAFQLYGSWKLAASHRPLFNLVVSNVPGPPEPLCFFGQPVHALLPHGPMMEGTGLNITALSYAGSIDVGILGCSRRVPEAPRLALRVAEAVEELAKLADAALPEVPPLARGLA